MIEIKINIPTIKDFWVWCNKRALENEKENWKRVNKIEDKICWHIRREPIPDENKGYLIEKINEEFDGLRLKRCIWPVKIKK